MLKKNLVWLLLLIAIIFLQFISAPSNFINPTPPNGTITINTSFISNVSISFGSDDYLTEVKWNWNGTNFTIYNSSLLFMMNFNNVSALGENSAKFVDLSKYSHNGTCTGTACPNWNSSGKYQGAVQFDGSDDYISLGTSDFGGSDDYTYAGWIKTNTSSLGYIYAESYTWGWYGQGIAFATTTSNRLQFKHTDDSGTFALLTSATSISNNNWHYFSATKNSSDFFALYIDGMLSNSTTSSISSSTTSNSINFGASNDYMVGYNGYYNGSLDEFRIWNYSMNSTEIYQQYVSNLYKFNMSQWYLYVNQSKNATSGLDNGTYFYYSSIKNKTSNENMTDIRWIIIGDPFYPLFSNIVTTPTNNSNYSSGAIYQFNVTIINTNGSAGIEFNGNNYTMSNLTSVFNKTIRDLGAGTYSYYFWAFGNGTSHNFNKTIIYHYAVNRSVGIVNGTINGTQGNFTSTSGTNIYINATNKTGYGSGKIYVNGTLYNSGTMPLSNLTNLPNGFYNITFVYNGNANFTGANQTWWVNITAPPSACSLDFTFSDVLANSIYWDIQTMPTINLSAEGNNGLDVTDYNLTITATNCNADLWTKADGPLTKVGGVQTIPLINEKWSYSKTDNTVPSSIKTSFTTEYATIDTNIVSTTVYFKFYLNASSSQTSGVYKNLINFKVTET